MTNPYQVVRDFEKAVAEYTGAPYAVAVNSCTMALLLAVAWHLRGTRPQPLSPQLWSTVVWPDRPEVEIPKRTYISVPMSIIHAGGKPVFRDEEWIGCYQLKPLPVFDSARWFTSGMYSGALGAWAMAPAIPQKKIGIIEGASIPVRLHGMVCVSFHASKTLGDTQGGAILHDNPEADAWLRRARFDGRTEGVAPNADTFTQIGWHCYMSNDVAARLLLKLYSLPKHNDPLPNDPYPDLSLMDIFK